jgi:4-methyl-5(b-hydroxyethyl)-thiazole monophosphate biosynthesis
MPGSERLRDSKTLQQITKKQAESCQPYAAICAAPVVALQSWGLLKGLHVCQALPFAIPSFMILPLMQEICTISYHF